MQTGDEITRTPPFKLLVNEEVAIDFRYSIKNELCRFLLSNFRLFFKPIQDYSIFYNVPIRLIDSVNVSDCSINVFTMYGLAFSVEFPSKSEANQIHERYNQLINEYERDNCIFYYAHINMLSQDYICLLDYRRLGLNRGKFKVKNLNKDRNLCKHYPEYCAFPASVSDNDIIRSIDFRANRRFVAVVYKHSLNGACIARSSQPAIGILCSRNEFDEKIIRALAMMGSNADKNRLKLNIVDARDTTSAYLNRAIGGGFEYGDYYVGTEIHFMEIPNIHTIRNAFNAVRDLIFDNYTSIPAVKAGFYSLEWPKFISTVINSATFIIDSIANHGTPVLVHCSDGWDRTPQLVSLAKLCLDPYYRTIKGFCVLIETEWVAFGHQFRARCNPLKDTRTRSPIFIQFLDCVYQLLCMYSTCFEFNSHMLTKIGIHCYLGLFNNFGIYEEPLDETSSIEVEDSYNSLDFDIVRINYKSKFRDTLWSYLIGREDDSFCNTYYNGPSSAYKVLTPKVDYHSVVFWQDMYLHGFWSIGENSFKNVGMFDYSLMMDGWSDYENDLKIPDPEQLMMDDSSDQAAGHRYNWIRRPCSYPKYVWLDSQSGDPSPFEVLESNQSGKLGQCRIVAHTRGVQQNDKIQEELKVLSRSLVTLMDSMDISKCSHIQEKLNVMLKFGDDQDSSEMKVSIATVLPIDYDGLVSSYVHESNYKLITYLRDCKRTLEDTLRICCKFIYKELKDGSATNGHSNESFLNVTNNNNNHDEEEDNTFEEMTKAVDVIEKKKTTICAQCNQKLRWIIKSRQKCGLCNNTFCKQCCSQMVTFEISPRAQRCINQVQVSLAVLKVCHQCADKYDGMRLRRFL